MEFIVLSIFPELVEAVFKFGIIRRAVEAGKLTYRLVNPREYATDKHRMVDDVAYGGKPGMVMKPEPVFNAYDALKEQGALKDNRLFIYLTPRGKLLTHELAERLAKYDQLILLCGRYEGVDERIVDALVDEEISIGDYVLSGAELAAMVVIDVVSRLLPGVVGNERSVKEDSFATGLLDYPHYTRPREYRGMRVPDVLLSGDHKAIIEWRIQQAERLTRERRPDLWEKYMERRKKLAEKEKGGKDTQA